MDFESPSKQETTSLAVVQSLELDLLESSLHEFTLDAWPTVEPARKFKDNWHLGAVCEHLQAVSDGYIKKLVINIPPRHLKSMTVQVFWPAWAWGRTQATPNPDAPSGPRVKWLCVAYNRALVIRDATKCRRVIGSPWYQERWGQVYQLATDQNVKSYYENDKGGARLIGSFDGGVTGEGGDVLVVDDPTQLEDAQNQNALEHAIEVWDGALATRLNDPENSARVIIMQRLNENDLTGHVLKEGGWTHLYLPAEFEPQRRCFTYLPKDVESEQIVGGVQVITPKEGAQPFFSDPREYEGELLHPDRFTPREIATLKAKGELNYAGQQQQRPASAAGHIFKRAWFKHYLTLPTGLDLFNDACVSWDCSFKDLESSSYVVCTVWARRGSDIYLVYRLRKRMGLPETLKAFKTIHTEMFPWIGPKYVEDKANGTAVIQTFKSAISGILDITPDGGKESRAQSITYLYQAGNVWHPDPDQHQWVKEFEDELANFPRGTYNDQVDSTSQALYYHFHLRPAGGIDLMEILEVGKNESMYPAQTRVF